MSDTQINDSVSSDPDPAENTSPQECNVSDSWTEVIQGLLGVLLLLGAVTMVFYYAPMAVQSVPPDDLQKQVHDLTAQVEQLQQEESMPADVLNSYCISNGHTYGLYN